MSTQGRPLHIMVTSPAQIPSVELGAIIPLSELQNQGLCVLKYKNEMLLSLADIAWCDVLLIVRGTSFNSVWIARWAKKLDRMVLGYWDDDFLSIPTYSLSYPYYSSPEVKENITVLFELINAFFSPSSKLAAKLSSIHGRVVKVLPVPLGTKELKPPERRTYDTPTVGHAVSLDHITVLNSLVVPAILAVADTGINFRVHLIGPKPDLIGKICVETVHTSYIYNYYDYLDFASKLDWDIGLAPQIDSEFTTYKFYNKLLEYTYIGCAGIYSKLEPYTGVIEDSVTGLLVENKREAWRDAILRLLVDSELRFKIANNAYEFVQSHHNRKVIAEGYATALEPFLDYRAPRVGRIYAITNELPYRFVSMWKFGMEYLRVYGARQLIRRAPRYLLSLLRNRLR